MVEWIDEKRNETIIYCVVNMNERKKFGKKALQNYSHDVAGKRPSRPFLPPKPKKGKKRERT